MFIDLGSLNNTGFGNLPDFVYSLFNLAISVSVVIAVISIVIAGFKFILSRGDQKKIDEAAKGIGFAILGLILVFLAPTVIQFIINEILTK